MTHSLVPGDVTAPVLKLDMPLSFWGGVDPESGEIVDKRHPQHGERVAGKLLVMPRGRGSSSSSSVLTETLRVGCGPAGIVLDEPDSILVVGALVARALYGAICPVVVTDRSLHDGEIWSLGDGVLTKNAG